MNIYLIGYGLNVVVVMDILLLGLLLDLVNFWGLGFFWNNNNEWCKNCDW